MTTENSFENYLNEHDEEAWSAALTTLLRRIHDVDKNATQICPCSRRFRRLPIAKNSPADC